MGVFEQFPYTNFHDLNLDWIIEKIKEIEDFKESIPGNIIDILDSINDKEDVEYLTNFRKLSLLGDFTGTLAGSLSALQVVEYILNNKEQIQFLYSQFADGQTGYVIDGGFFLETGIQNNYSGGYF